MSLNLLREMREALHEFHQAYAYVCELHEAGLEAGAAVPRPSKMDPHKASAAANLVSKNHGERNKHTVMAHTAAANAHSVAAREAEAAGKGHLASAHKKAMSFHMSHQHGPKPVAPAKTPMNIKRPVAPAAKPAAPAAEAVDLGASAPKPLAPKPMAMKKKPVGGGTLASAKPPVRPGAVPPAAPAAGAKVGQKKPGAPKPLAKKPALGV